jgi:hypothetical protein
MHCIGLAFRFSFCFLFVLLLPMLLLLCITGVDSMVICKILKLLMERRPQMNIHKILALHIDYGNRPESSREAAFVQQWCTAGGAASAVSGELAAADAASAGRGDATFSGGGGCHGGSAMLGGVICRIRRVDEVTRGVTNRDEYEKISRDIRYEFYRTCIAEELSSSSTAQHAPSHSPDLPGAIQLASAERGISSLSVAELSGGAGSMTAGSRGADPSDPSEAAAAVVVSGVIFGHHLGDIQENVISNIMRLECYEVVLTNLLVICIYGRMFVLLQRKRTLAAVRHDGELGDQRSRSVAPAAGSHQRRRV